VLKARIRQTDRQAGGRTGKTCNAPYEDGHIIVYCGFVR